MGVFCGSRPFGGGACRLYFCSSDVRGNRLLLGSSRGDFCSVQEFPSCATRCIRREFAAGDFRLLAGLLARTSRDNGLGAFQSLPFDPGLSLSVAVALCSVRAWAGRLVLLPGPARAGINVVVTGRAIVRVTTDLGLRLQKGNDGGRVGVDSEIDGLAFQVIGVPGAAFQPVFQPPALCGMHGDLAISVSNAVEDALQLARHTPFGVIVMDLGGLGAEAEQACATGKRQAGNCNDAE